MADLTPEEARTAFLRSFKQLAPYRHRYEVLRDFVTMAACALHNGLHQEAAREAEYLEINARYKPEDQKVFPKLLANLIVMLEPEPRDILGPLYMELEIANKDAGQFFTPPPISEMMARLTFNDELAKLDNKPFITVQEPACGAGGIVLALVKVMVEAKHNPADTLWVQCIDVDRLAALMCYVQLTLWHVPAQVVVGNTLTLETREVWCTPAHHLGFWDARLEQHEHSSEPVVADPLPEPEKVSEPDQPAYDEYRIDWRGQTLLIRHCPSWLGQETAHLEITSPDRAPHPLSETGYRSHFINPGQIEAVGGPVQYVQSWLVTVDDGKAKQLSLF